MVLLSESLFGTAESVGVAVFVIVYLVILLVALGFGMVWYVLQSLGLYTIAERRGIRNPWLAWVPVANMWVLGSISDQYQYLTKGKIKNRRRTLVALMILLVGTYIAMIVGGILAAFSGTETASILATVFGGLLCFAVAIALCIVAYMCYYDLFCSCEPGNAVLYLVLSIVISAAFPIVVFLCRKKDLGMPKRKEAEVLTETEEKTPEEASAEEEPMEEGFAKPEEFADESNL